MAASGTLTRAARHRGRPADPQARLSEVVNYRDTVAAVDDLCRAAIKAGVSVNTYVRELVRRARSAEISVGKESHRTSRQ